MSAAAHTPGPWAWNEQGYTLRPTSPKTGISLIFTLESGPRIFRYDNLDLDAVDREHRANLQLIAAAPDLLEALQIARDYAAYAQAEPADLALIDAALAKAAGEGAPA